jgi:hypothetical protein
MTEHAPLYCCSMSMSCGEGLAQWWLWTWLAATQRKAHRAASNTPQPPTSTSEVPALHPTLDPAPATRALTPHPHLRPRSPPPGRCPSPGCRPRRPRLAPPRPRPTRQLQESTTRGGAWAIAKQGAATSFGRLGIGDFLVIPCRASTGSAKTSHHGPHPPDRLPVHLTCPPSGPATHHWPSPVCHRTARSLAAAARLSSYSFFSGGMPGEYSHASLLRRGRAANQRRGGLI